MKLTFFCNIKNKIKHHIFASFKLNVRENCNCDRKMLLLIKYIYQIILFYSPSTSGSLTPVRITTEMKLSPRGAESADDESSGEESTPTQKSTPSKKVRKGRIPPEGRERAKNNYDGSYLSSMTRDEESMDSICGVTGILFTLVTFSSIGFQKFSTPVEYTNILLRSPKFASPSNGQGQNTKLFVKCGSRISRIL